MAILINKQSAVIVQGITGREGNFYTQQMIADGTQIVGGVTPGKGGEWIHGKPVFDSVKKAVDATGANTCISFAPANAAIDAIYEAIDAQIKIIVCVTQGIPTRDMMRLRAHLQNSQSRLIGPNCAGILTPAQSSVGLIPAYISKPGNVGVISRSGTLMYEVVLGLTQAGYGQTTCVGIGGDVILGSDFVDMLRLFEEDPDTEKIVLIGEIGGRAEIDAAEFIRAQVTKPVIAYVAGKSAPPFTAMGHTGAIAENRETTAGYKIEKLIRAGVSVAEHPEQIALLLGGK